VQNKTTGKNIDVSPSKKPNHFRVVNPSIHALSSWGKSRVMRTISAVSEAHQSQMGTGGSLRPQRIYFMSLFNLRIEPSYYLDLLSKTIFRHPLSQSRVAIATPR
jgi:hypothetical protein